MDREFRLAKKILENAGYSVIKSMHDSVNYEQYSEDQLEDAIYNIEGRVEEITRELRDTYYDNRDDLLDELDSLSSELSSMEEYLSDELYHKSEEIMDIIRRAEDTDYDGPPVHRDPYRERGLNPADFH